MKPTAADTEKARPVAAGVEAPPAHPGRTAEDTAAGRRGLAAQLGCFVPAHPIAGKELAGVENGEATLFDGRKVVLTPGGPAYVVREQGGRRVLDVMN